MKSTKRVAIITGSTKGIGKSIATLMIQKGLNVVVNGRDADQVQQTVTELQSLGGQAVGLASPVEHPTTGETLVDLAMNTFGRVDILINNAGIIRDNLAINMSTIDFSDVVDIHVKGTFYCSKPFIKALKDQNVGGHLINMTSLAGLEGTVGQVNYSAAKSAINAITWTLAKELKRDHIQVNAIAPAAHTDMTRPYVEKAKQKAAQKEEPLPSYWEIGSPDDVATFVLTLLTRIDMSISGEIYGINGSNMVRWKPPISEPYISK